MYLPFDMCIPKLHNTLQLHLTFNVVKFIFFKEHHLCLWSFLEFVSWGAQSHANTEDVVLMNPKQQKKFSVTLSIWKVFMQMPCNLTQNLFYAFDKTSPKILSSLYFW